MQLPFVLTDLKIRDSTILFIQNFVYSSFKKLHPSRGYPTILPFYIRIRTILPVLRSFSAVPRKLTSVKFLVHSTFGFLSNFLYISFWIFEHLSASILFSLRTWCSDGIFVLCIYCRIGTHTYIHEHIREVPFYVTLSFNPYHFTCFIVSVQDWFLTAPMWF